MSILTWKDTDTWVWKDTDTWVWKDGESSAITGAMFIAFSQLYPLIQFDKITPDITFEVISQ